MNTRLLAALTVIILVSGLTLKKPSKRGPLDPISTIRAWALTQNLWPKLSSAEGHVKLIAVREVYKETQAQLTLKAYLLTPCRNLCGEGEDCARQCQQLIKDWEGLGGDARLLIEAYDHKHRRLLGRVTLHTIAPIKLRYWSRKQRLIALTQTVSRDDNRLHLLDLVDPAEVDFLQETDRDVISQPTSTPRPRAETKPSGSEERLALRYYDHFTLGPFSGSSNAPEGSTNFVDLDGDQRVELVAPLEVLVRLTPRAISVPTTYQLSPTGLKFDPTLIKAEVPARHELREWILQRRGEPQDKAPREIDLELSRATPILVHAAQLCLIARCEGGDELVSFAYPQHDVIARVWTQLRARIARFTAQPQAAQTSRSHPFSALDRRFSDSTSQRSDQRTQRPADQSPAQE